MNEKAKFKEVSDEQSYRINEVRNKFSKIYDLVDQFCKPSRETSLALTKLEEAQFWVIKGISKEEK